MLVAACAPLSHTAAQGDEGAPASAAIAKPSHVPPDDSLDAVAWSQTAVEHDMLTREIYRNAQGKLLQALHDHTWDALPHDERSGSLEGLKPAVILDVDETVLDNSAYQARLIRDHAFYNDASWAAWTKEEAATAIPGALAFTRFAARHGIAVIYLTNRDKSLDAATLANLRKLGFPVHGKYAFLGLGTYVKGCEQIGTQKTCRRKLVGRHYRVLMQFGDQIGDFTGVIANTPQGRRKAARAYMPWVGERWFVLPNAQYGSWQPALFHNDWQQPAEQRRKQMLEHLRYN